MRAIAVCILFTVVAAIPGVALAGACANVRKKPQNPAFSERARKVIAEQAHIALKQSEPVRISKIEKYFGQGPWHFVWAEPETQEPGLFILRSEGKSLQYIDVWGGVALEDEEDQVRAWLASKAPSAIKELIRCVAHFLVTHEE
jgi:hypothetical protein